MVSVALSHLHPNFQRVDGSGGDAGRDVYFETDAGLLIYELKSFSERIDITQRKQIIRSLKRAKTHSPKKWFLVVPVDPTPGEIRWFKGVKKSCGCDFPTYWRGRAWLNDLFAKRPEVRR